MRMYVIASPEHFELDHNLDVTKERHSIDGTLAVIEVDSSGLSVYDECENCTVHTHETVLAALNTEEAAGVWHPDKIASRQGGISETQEPSLQDFENIEPSSEEDGNSNNDQ